MRTFRQETMFFSPSNSPKTLKMEIKDTSNQKKHITRIYQAAYSNWNMSIVQQFDLEINGDTEEICFAMRNIAALFVM